MGLNVGEAHIAFLADAIHCKHDSLGANPKRISTWKPVITRFYNSPTLWKGKMLSMAGGICLIKSVLNSPPLYYMSHFLMPKGVARLLASIQRRFLRAGVSKQRKICKIQ